MRTRFPKGLHTHRLKANPDEKRFAEAWSRQNKHGNNLAYLLDERPVQTGQPPDPSARDYVVAATVIQWLGSPVGQAFLDELGFPNLRGKPSLKPNLSKGAISHMRQGLEYRLASMTDKQIIALTIALEATKAIK